MALKYRAVLWDFDGVIFDSDKEAWRAGGALLAHHGLEMEPYERFRHRASNHWQWYFERGVPWSTEECRTFFYAHYDLSGCGLVAGVREILPHLRDRDVSCGIVSAHHTDDIITKLEKFGIAEHFPHVAGDAYHKKEALEEACKALGVECAEALFVGDMLSDVADGKAAGVATVLFAPADSPHVTEAHHHITELPQLLKLLIED